MATRKNPVSILMEVGTRDHLPLEFEIVDAIGVSHQPRFLCQWRIVGKQPFPSVFAASKKDGKLQSAVIALEGLDVFRPRNRSFVNYIKNGKILAIVDSSTIKGLEDWVQFSPLENNQPPVDPVVPSFGSILAPDSHMLAGSLPTSAPVPPPGFHSFAGSPGMTSQIGVAPDHYSSHQPMFQPRKPQKMPRPSLGVLANQNSRTMSAFDDQTMQHLLSGRSSYNQQQVAAGHSADTNSLSLSIRSLNLGSTASHNSHYQPPSDMIGGDPAAPLTNNPFYAPMQIVQAPDNGQDMDVEGVKGVDAAALDLERGSKAISELYQLSQKMGITPVFEVLDSTGPPHAPLFQCRCTFDKHEAVVTAMSKDKGKRETFIKVLAKVKADKEFTNAEQSEDSIPTEKHPISAVMEMGSKLGIGPEFDIQQIKTVPLPIFSGTCQFGEKKFGPVQGSNKQNTKTEVAKLALSCLQDDPEIKAQIAIKKHRISTPTLSSSSTTLTSGSSSSSDNTTVMSPEDMQNLLNQKHPVSAFMEYAQGRRKVGEFVELSVTGPPHCRSFVYKCTIDGRSFPQAKASTKKEAKKHAAELALKELSGCVDSGPPRSVNRNSIRPSSVPDSSLSSMSAVPNTKSDMIASQVLHQFNTLKSQSNGDLGKVILAGFVLEDEDRSDNSYTTISIGTGNRCISGSFLSKDGTSVNDCHAEVIARRGLLRYLYKEIEKHKSDSSTSIFSETASKNNKLILRGNLKIHLYISTAPCGDGALFTHNEADKDLTDYSMNAPHEPINELSTEGMLRSKLEGGEGTIPTGQKDDSVVQTYDGITRGDVRLKTMSCSDKICKWNVLGIQGTLLSQLIDPIYMETLILGQLFHPGHLSRALCCRVNLVEDYLKADNIEMYHVNHIKIDCTSQKLSRSTAKSKPISLNWMCSDGEVELLDGETGQIIPATHNTDNSEGSRVSRVSRRRLYQTYLRVKPDKSQESSLYSDTKASVTEYNKVKVKLYDTFSELQKGVWVKKPAEQNQFTVMS